MTTTLKTCFKCGESKERTEFYKHPQMGDGLLGKCKECTKNDMRQRYAEKYLDIREYDRQRANLPHRQAARALYAKTKASALSRNASNRRHREENPQASKARYSTLSAIRDGNLIREPCFICGSEDSEAHHSTYDDHTMVTWLCPTHHAQAHREHRQWLREMGVHKPLRQKV